MIIAVVVIVVVVLAALVYLARRRRPDPVDDFRRQIDALSPEARRPTIDQVRAADDDAPEGTDASRDDGTDPDGDVS